MWRRPWARTYDSSLSNLYLKTFSNNLSSFYLVSILLIINIGIQWPVICAFPNFLFHHKCFSCSKWILINVELSFICNRFIFCNLISKHDQQQDSVWQLLNGTLVVDAEQIICYYSCRANRYRELPPLQSKVDLSNLQQLKPLMWNFKVLLFSECLLQRVIRSADTGTC